jgi:hypothetical protein
MSKVPFVIKKTIFNMNTPKVRSTIPKEGLAKGWWNKGWSWQCNMSKYLRGCRSFEGGVEWYALPFN